MTGQEPRLQPGATPEHHALLVEATEAAYQARVEAGLEPEAEP